MLQLRSSLVLLSLVFSLIVGVSPTPAQSVASIVEDMRAQYEQQLETVDTYIVETTLYTSYNRKVMQQMENMPAQQRKQMENMMGNQMEMMEQMVSGDPIVVEVQSVTVNVDMPAGMF